MPSRACFLRIRFPNTQPTSPIPGQQRVRAVDRIAAGSFISKFSEPRQDVNTKPNEAAMAKVLDLYNGRGRGAELGTSSGTALGLLNAVTEFVDHERRARNSDYRLDSAWFGQGAALKQKALDRTLALLA